MASDYADLASIKPLPCKGFRDHIGITVFVKVVEANGSYAAGSAGSNGGLIQADPGR